MLSILFGPLLLGILGAYVGGILLLPLLLRLKVGQVINTWAPESHKSKGGTPTMGGAIILVGAFSATLLFPGPPATGIALAGVLLATIGFAAVGFVDDYLIVKRGKNLGLRAREKLAGQFLVAGLFVMWQLLWENELRPSGSILGDPMRMVLAGYHLLLLVGLSNAVNLTDGLDGLAAGVSLPVWMTLAVLGLFAPHVQSAARGDVGVVIFCAAFAGATLGYLWFNAHPAQVFMGDVGSLAIGGGMAAAAITFRQEWLLLLVALVHWVEMASVIIQVTSFKTTGKRVFKMSPLHHHYEKCGEPETRIVARFSILSAVCCLLALSMVFRGV